MTQGAYYTTGIGAAFGKFVSGKTNLTVSGTPERITTTSTPIPGIWVAADLGNTSPLVVGEDQVDATSGSMQGIVIVPGNPSIFLPYNNLNLVYFDGQTTNDDLVWGYFQPVTD